MITRNEGMMREYKMKHKKTLRCWVILALLLIMALVGTVSAGTVTISPGQSIAAAITSAGTGGIVILNPGIYYQNDISIGNAITLKADTADGHGPWDTIIDGSTTGTGIFTDTGYALSIDNLTIQNTYENSAIDAVGSPVTVTSSSFTGCSASGSSSAGTIPGAIYVGGPGGTLTVVSSTFTGCSGGGGGSGAISFWNCGPVTVTSSRFIDCTGGYDGSSGAIESNGGANPGADPLTVTSSTFTGCSASGAGGASAIFAGLNGTVNSSTFTDCYTYAPNGGVIIGTGGTINFCRFYNDFEYTGTGPGITVYQTGAYSIDAQDNWWGTNTGPAGQTHGTVDANPWLVLGVTASPSTISPAQTTIVKANLTYDSAGTDTSGNGYIQDDIPVTFSNTGSGTVFPVACTYDRGAQTTFTPSSAGTAYITATVDGQSVTIPVTVTAATSTINTTSIAIDPRTPSNVYAGLDGVGIYYSTTSGGSWTAASTQPGNTHISALVIDPIDSTRLFAATDGGGVYYSTNSAANWNACPAEPANQNVISLAANATGALYAGTEAGVYISANNCTSWTAMNTGLP